MTPPPTSRLSVLLWPVLLIFLLASLLAALHWYFAQDFSSFSLAQLSFGDVLLAVFLQLVALGMVSFAWQHNLHRQGVRRFSMRQSIVMVGFSTIGKYTPGKIWGMLARGAVVYRHLGQSKTAVIATLVEQLALIHSGALLSLAALIWMSVAPLAAIITAMLLLPTVWWVSRSEWLLGRLLSLLRRDSQIDLSGFRASYASVFFILLLMWLVVAAVLGLAFSAYGATQLPQFSLILLTAVLSYIGGFVAVFAPAGLGVREGIVVALLSPVAGPSAAIAVSLLYRLITAGADILMGTAALILYSRETTRDASTDGTNENR